MPAQFIHGSSKSGYLDQTVTCVQLKMYRQWIRLNYGDAEEPKWSWHFSYVSPTLRMTNAPVILSRLGRYVVPTLLTPTFRRNWCWFRPGATLCHDVLHCCHAIATPEPRYCPVMTRLTSDTGKFSCVVLRYVSLPPRCSLAVATLSCAVPRIWRNIACHNVSEKWHNGVCIPPTFLHVSATPQSRCTTSCYAIITLAMRCYYVILRCGKRTWISNMFKIQVR